MTLLIKPKKLQPTTSLKEKHDDFKFQMPSAKVVNKAKETARMPTAVVDNETDKSNAKTHTTKVVNKPNTTTTNTIVATAPVGNVDKTKTNLADANKLLVGKTKTKSNLLAPKSPPQTTLIPEMSTDKYEVVADSIPEFSEKAGNKFEEQIIMLQQAIDGTGELKDQMVNILTFLDDNPQYKDNVSPKDVAVFVAACRKVAGITVQEKVARKTKNKKSTAKIEEVFSDLADLTFDL